jgi:hypothetical protein
MTDNAKVSMILCADLEPTEQEKVERLDGPISERFSRVELNERIVCQGSGEGSRRLLTFRSGTGIVARVAARDFLAASDEEAVAKIALGGKFRMVVHYHLPGKETGPEPPVFKYLLTAEPSANKTSKVAIVDMNPPGTPRALQTGEFSAKTDDPETALLSGVARLDSHHDELRHVTGEVQPVTREAAQT